MTSTRRCTAGFRDEGDLVALVGPVDGGARWQRVPEGGSRGQRGLAPHLDLDLERRVQAFILEAIAAGLLHSAHDCAEGGIAVALAESCLLGDIGAG